jgi:hypothetical protein
MNIAESLFGACIINLIQCGTFIILYPTKNSMTVNDTSGAKLTSGAKKYTTIARIIALLMPASGEFAPALILAIVLAIDPVVAIPPNSGDVIFARP